MLIAVATRERAECMGRTSARCSCARAASWPRATTARRAASRAATRTSRAAIAAPTASSIRADRPTTCASACTRSRTRSCRRRGSATRSKARTATRRCGRASAASRSCARPASSASSSSTPGSRAARLERDAYYGLLESSDGSGVAIEQLELDPAVLELAARAVRRPPPIAGLFTLLAAGLAVIAVAAGGGAKVPAFAAAVLAAWMAGSRAPTSMPAEEAPRR